MLFLRWPSGEKKLVSDLIFIFEQTDIMEGSAEVLGFCQNVDFQNIYWFITPVKFFRSCWIKVLQSYWPTIAARVQTSFINKIPVLIICDSMLFPAEWYAIVFFIVLFCFVSTYSESDLKQIVKYCSFQNYMCCTFGKGYFI